MAKIGLISLYSIHTLNETLQCMHGLIYYTIILSEEISTILIYICPFAIFPVRPYMHDSAKSSSTL